MCLGPVNDRGKRNEYSLPTVTSDIQVIQKPEKKSWYFHIIAYNFCSKSHFCMIFAQLLCCSRTKISWEFQIDNMIVARYISVVITPDIEQSKKIILKWRHLRMCTLFILVFIYVHFIACNQSIFHPEKAAWVSANTTKQHSISADPKSVFSKS